MTASTAKPEGAAKPEEVRKPRKRPAPPQFTFHTLVRDGAGGYREVTAPEEMRQIAVRLMLAGAGITPETKIASEVRHSKQDQSKQDHSEQQRRRR